MTHDCCLTDRVVWCWLTQIMTHHRASLVTDPASWPFYFLGTSQHSFHITYHMSMSHIANMLHDDRQYGDCEMSGWYQQTVDVHCGLHRCCYLVLTMCWRQWHLCRSSPPSQTCEEHITNRVVRDQGRPGTLDITPCAGLGRWQRAAVYISQYALFPSSPLDIRYNTAFWITYDNFIACKRRVNRVIRIFIGSATTYMNNNKTLFFPWGLSV